MIRSSATVRHISLVAVLIASLGVGGCSAREPELTDTVEGVAFGTGKGNVCAPVGDAPILYGDIIVNTREQAVTITGVSFEDPSGLTLDDSFIVDPEVAGGDAFGASGLPVTGSLKASWDAREAAIGSTLPPYKQLNLVVEASRSGANVGTAGSLVVEFRVGESAAEHRVSNLMQIRFVEKDC